MQLSAYGELVWTATWQAALLAAVVFAITATMSRFISASWRAALWALPVLRFVMLVLPVTSISVANFLPFSGTDSLADSYVQDFLHLENRYPRADVSDPVANNELETQAEQTPQPRHLWLRILPLRPLARLASAKQLFGPRFRLANLRSLSGWLALRSWWHGG